jgi:hypothetical protein
VDDLPFVDVQEVVLPVGPDQAWEVLERQVERSLAANPWPKAGFTWVLGTDPPAGFEVVDRRPPDALVLGGRHRFSRYRLTFELDDGAADGTTTVRAVTHAAFPGLHGKAYRLAVISSGLHVVATRRILESIRRASAAPGT